MLQNNEAMKKTNSTEEASWLIIKGQRERSNSRGFKRDPEASNHFAYYYCRKPWHIKKNCMKSKKMLMKKDDKDSDGTSTSGKPDHTGVIEQADGNPCDVLTAQLGEGKYSDAWLLDSECTYHMCPKRVSVLTSLMTVSYTHLTLPTIYSV